MALSRWTESHDTPVHLMVPSFPPSNRSYVGWRHLIGGLSSPVDVQGWTYDTHASALTLALVHLNVPFGAGIYKALFLQDRRPRAPLESASFTFPGPLKLSS